MALKYPITREIFLDKVCKLARKTLTPEQMEERGSFYIASKYQEFTNAADKRYFITSTFIEMDGVQHTIQDDYPLIVEHGEDVPEEPLNRHIDRLKADLEKRLGREVEIQGNRIKVTNMWADLWEKVSK